MRGMARLAVIDAAIDSSGAGHGEERAPAALRAAGLVERLSASDAGEADAHMRDTQRDPDTGVIGAAEVRQASMAIAARVREVLQAGERPLVLGGDCTLLLGVFQALPRGSGLWFVDGHADFFDGRARQRARRPTWTSRSSRATARPGYSSETNRCSSRPLSRCSGIVPASFTPTSPARTPASTQPFMPSRRPRCASAGPP